TLAARGTHLNKNDVNKLSVSSYKIRVVVNKEPDPSPTVNRYRIVAYAYADNDTTINVPIPGPITVNGRITWNGGIRYHPLNVPNPMSSRQTLWNIFLCQPIVWGEYLFLLMDFIFNN